MVLIDILVLAGIAALYRLLGREKGRVWFMLVISILALYWLQPLTPIRSMDFWLPTLTLTLSVIGWVISSPKENRFVRDDKLSIVVILLIITGVALSRYLNIGMERLITPSAPPPFEYFAIYITIAGIIIWWLSRFSTSSILLKIAIWIIIGLLIILKLPILSLRVSEGLRLLAGQNISRAAFTDIRWLGFSYLAFRLIHTFRDRQLGRLPVVTLKEYLVYMVFFPSITAGPIDRIERFIKDLRKTSLPVNEDFTYGGKRLVIGLLKKFVIADSLGIIALNSVNAGQVIRPEWYWILLYAYSFQIFFDFSGYTDIAIGLGRLLSVQLPENFNNPYLKPNLTLFWNNWHMTLTQWFRTYYFNPVTRYFRTRKKIIQPVFIIFFTQVTTMVLIGLWHGISWNFVYWGLWHGFGLFFQNRYSEWIRPHIGKLEDKPAIKKVFYVVSIVITFQYVSLGWIWFTLPDPKMSIKVILGLFGIS